MGELEPAEVFPLAEYLCDEMDARGWGTADVAVRMPGDAAMNQMKVDLVLTVVDRGLIVDDETFDGLALAFGVSRGFFRHLDAVWRQWPDRRAEFSAPERLFEPRLYHIAT